MDIVGKRVMVRLNEIEGRVSFRQRRATGLVSDWSFLDAERVRPKQAGMSRAELYSKWHTTESCYEKRD